MSGIILIVEDHDAVRELLCDWLGAEFPQYQFIAVPSGEEAIVAAHIHEPASIIMDISLPGISGIQAAQRIRTDGVTAPIVMLTIHEEEVYRAAAAAAGASAYVTKRQMRLELIPTLQALLPVVSEERWNHPG
jgi:CheY-like chemotaxis protein